MNHKTILTRAWKILWSYKTLWVFGILLSLTTSTFSDRILQFGDNSRHASSSPTDQRSPFTGDSFQEGWQEMVDEFNLLFDEIIPEDVVQTVITISILVGCLVLVIILARGVFRYISETAIIRMVADYETDDTTHTWREGFRIGWSRTAWRLFLIDLMVNVPVFLAFVLVFALILAPLFLWITGVNTLAVFGSVVSIGLFVVAIFLVILVSAGLNLLRKFFHRSCVLDGHFGKAALIKSFIMVKDNFKDVILMWLVMVGVNIGFGIAIIPIVILVLITAGITGGLIGLTAGGITSIFTDGTMPVIVGAIVGSPVFFLVLIAPLAFISGLKETYTSTTWTLTYRELSALKTLKSIQSEALPESSEILQEDEDLH